jgi:hypothetical protein
VINTVVVIGTVVVVGLGAMIELIANWVAERKLFGKGVA